MLERAIALEPGYAEAWRWLAMVNLIGWLYLGEAEEPWRKLALTQAKRALELDPTDPDGHWVYGAALFYERQWDEAARETTLAVTLNPNCADGWSNLADMRLLDGDAREALACAKRCWQLNPVTSTIAYWVLAQAHFALGNFEEAVRTLRGSGTGGASARRDLAAALAELGRMGEARAEAALFMADFPHFTIAHWVETQPFRDLGMRDRFVNAYRKAGLPEGRANQSAAKPSVAVLPFANLGGDPQQDFIADGLSEDLIMELGQFLELRVIAHHSSFAFRGGTTPLAEIARQLDVRYVVEGSVRKAGPELRVSARLADVSNHTQLWSGRYDRPAEAVAEIRDDLVRSVAAAIQGHVAADDAARAQRKPPASWTAYEHFLRGRSLSLRYRDREALPFLERAAELDPGNSTIQAWRAIVLALNFLHDPDGDWLDRAFVAAQTALALSDTDPRCHHAMAVVRDWRGEFERAGEHYARARELSPADLIIIYDHAAWFNHTGRPAEALALLDRARRDDPLPPPFAQKLRGIFLFQLGHYEEAIGEMERLAEPFPWADALLASAYALTGRMEEAARHVHRLKKLMPGANLASAERSLGSCTPELARSYVEGLRLAGLGDD